MKFLHTSDWHLGISLCNMPLLAEQEHFLSCLSTAVDSEKIDAVIVAGDVFDSSVSSSEAISLYNSAVTKICGELNVPVIIIAGNHDGAARLASCRELLKGAGLYVTGRLTRDIEPIIIGNAAVYPIPYFNIDEVRALFPETEIKSYEAAMLTVCDGIRKKMNRRMKSIVVSHAFISGAALSESDRAAVIGTVNMVSADVFEGFDYVALGHLHKPQSIRENVRYSGSPIKYSFSEAAGKKSVTITDTDDMSVSQLEITPLHDMRVLKGSYDELVSGAQYSEDYIKIEVTDRYAGLMAVDTFRSFYPNLLSLCGKAEEGTEQSALTVSEVEAMSPDELLLRFLMETAQFTPNSEQLRLFNEALEKSCDGGDMS